MYNPKATQAEQFIDDAEICRTLAYAQAHKNDPALLGEILEKAKQMQGLSHQEVALLLACDNQEIIDTIKQTAMQIKDEIYGKRIVFFAPLYLSNYCVNACTYCGYHRDNQQMIRKKLTQAEIHDEIVALQNMGHKRLALEIGEDHTNTPLSYLLESIKTIYGVKHKNGAIRRVNVNIAATTVADYQQLAAADIGTYILLQETYHKKTYEQMHPAGPKHNYAYHTEAMDRAMQGNIDDVGIGVLYGLYDYQYDTVAMMLHVAHLEQTFGVGPHTISLPRLRFASGVDLGGYQLVSDDDFYRIVAVLRCAVPYTGMIISTRESGETRKQLLALGISQLSGGSCTGVGGYASSSLKENKEQDTSQFTVDDHRSLDQIMGELAIDGYIPSFCTACYREGRTGDRFMRLAKSGEIKNVCQPNALMTLQEYAIDYASAQTKCQADRLIKEELKKITNPETLKKTEDLLKRIQTGERDIRF